jgi:hypothetical protein
VNTHKHKNSRRSSNNREVVVDAEPVERVEKELVVVAVLPKHKHRA